MKRIELFECEICRRQYNNEESALNCEARGPGKEYPIGCVYGDHTPGSMYNDITFAVAENRAEVGTFMGHTNQGYNWACRDNGSGDSLGEYMCCGISLYLGKNHYKVDPIAPHFMRMIKYLRDHQIEITVWDGTEPVLWATFIKRVKEGNWYK